MGVPMDPGPETVRVGTPVWYWPGASGLHPGPWAAWVVALRDRAGVVNISGWDPVGSPFCYLSVPFSATAEQCRWSFPLPTEDGPPHTWTSPIE